MNASEQIEFTELRRLNQEIDLDEVTIINTIGELTELYSKLNDPSIPRSAPIPVFDENNESVLVLKPRLKHFGNGDIEILGIEKTDSKLKINYKEGENWEYSENKWSNPILIIQVSHKVSEVKLNTNN